MRNAIIVEDVAETRTWLVGAVAAAFPHCDVRSFVDVRSGIHAAKGLPVDLAIIDLGLPDGDGQSVVSAFREHQPDATIIVATIMGDDASIVSALSAGAHGYLLKDTPQELFARQLSDLAQGLPALSPSIARRIVDHFRSTAATQKPDATLTPREKEVLTLIGRGLRNSEVADALSLTENTVATHIKSIYAKLDVSSRVEAALKASRMGLT